MPKVYLIGTTHLYQFGPTPFTPILAVQFDEFRELLRQSARRNQVRAIAEEMSLEALTLRNLKESIPKQIAAELGLGHRYCDPNKSTRKEKRISANSEREAYWRDQILTMDLFPVLYVCGADHVRGFSKLLSESGIPVDITALDWESKATG